MKSLFLKIVVTSLLLQYSVIGLAFTSSSIFKLFKGVPISRVTLKSLQNFPKNEQIKFLIERGKQTGRISPMKSLSLQAKFSKIPNGEEVLYACLKDIKCNPHSAIKNIEAYKSKLGHYPPKTLSKMIATDDLYLKLALKNPKLKTGDLRLEAGKIAERMMDKNFRTSGWTKIEGEVGRNGFDGLYVKLDKNGNVKSVMIVESKYGKSASLSRTMDGARQMSSQWSNKKIDDLIKKYPNDPKYKQIKLQLQQSKVKHRLYRFRVTDNKIYQSIEKVNRSNLKEVKTSGLSGAEKLRSANRTENTIIELDNP